MRKIDYHLHTHHSFDSEGVTEEYILEAIKKGLDEICFTDHHDINYPGDDFTLNTREYFEELRMLQKKYNNKIKIKIGVEIGLDLNYVEKLNDFVRNNDFDFVIGSIHTIKNTEFYYGKFFKGKTKSQAHLEFFEETLKCVEKFDCFDLLGHLDYIKRYGPYDDKNIIDYDKYHSIFDQIFKTLISKNKGIEVNISGYAINKTHGFPNYDLIQRYYDLGGRIITIGTDSHGPNSVGTHLQDVIDQLTKIGFKDITTFTKRKRDNYGTI